LNIASPSRSKNCTEQLSRPMKGRRTKAIATQRSARMWPPIGLSPCRLKKPRPKLPGGTGPSHSSTMLGVWTITSTGPQPVRSAITSAKASAGANAAASGGSRRVASSVVTPCWRASASMTPSGFSARRAASAVRSSAVSRAVALIVRSVMRGTPAWGRCGRAPHRGRR